MTVERPLRLAVDLNPDSIDSFRKVCIDAGEEQLATLVDTAAEHLGPGPHNDFNAFLSSFEALAGKAGLKLTAKRLKLIQNSLARRDESAVPVIKKIQSPERLKPIHCMVALKPL